MPMRMGGRSASMPTTAFPRSRCRCCSDIQKDLSPSILAAVAAARYDGAGKIGLQFKRRFWEPDDEIYGGRWWTDQEVGQSHLSFAWLQHEQGRADRLFPGFPRHHARAPAGQIQRLALEHGSRIHPQYTAEFESAFSVSWTRVPWSRGSWRGESSAAHDALTSSPPTRRPRAFRRRLHDRHELVDAGSLRLGSRSLDGAPPDRAHALKDRNVIRANVLQVASKFVDAEDDRSLCLRSGGCFHRVRCGAGGRRASDTVITLQRTSCFGPCPIYAVSIDASGTVPYEGERFVRVVGRRTAHIDPAVVARLLARAEQIRFSGLRSAYRAIENPDGTTTMVTDLPTKIVTITAKGRTKRVEDYVAAPDSLTEFERGIDHAAGTTRWVFLDEAALRELIQFRLVGLRRGRRTLLRRRLNATTCRSRAG